MLSRPIINKAELRLLIKMWINYCSDDKTISEERLDKLSAKFRVGKMLYDLDKEFSYIADKDNSKLIETILSDYETATYNFLKNATEEEFEKQTFVIVFEGCNYSILKTDLPTLNSVCYKLCKKNL